MGAQKKNCVCVYIILSSIMRIIYLNEESVDEKIRNKFQEESEHSHGTQQRIKAEKKEKRVEPNQSGNK